MEEDKLSALIAAGPDPTRGLQNLVLFRFMDIARARADLRQWPEIAEALNMPGRAKALAAAFSRVKKRVEDKELEPPKSSPAPRPTSQGQTTAISPHAAKSEPATDTAGARPVRPGWTHIPIDK